jgi:YnbE-like lipoprotein
MITLELTNRANTAKTLHMQGVCSRKRRSLRGSARTLAVMVGMGGTVALGGCVSVNAPDKPIVIELNINIKQEVVYRLAADAATTIDKNPGIF